jgi:hypothetical protein
MRNQTYLRKEFFCVRDCSGALFIAVFGKNSNKKAGVKSPTCKGTPK